MAIWRLASAASPQRRGLCSVILFVLAAGLAWLGLWRTLQTLAPRRRAIPALARTTGLLAVFLCLRKSQPAHPAILSWTPSSKRYAVVVDRSESMLLCQSNRRETRFDRAWARWLKSRPAGGNRTRLDFHVFGSRLVPVAGEEAVRTTSVDGAQTALHASLAELLSRLASITTRSSASPMAWILPRARPMN